MKRDDINFPSSLFIEIINNLNMKDYHKLMELFIIFEKYTKKNGIEIIQEELIKTIHYTGIYFIENDK